MASRFEVVVDKSARRINHFHPVGHESTVLLPEEMYGYIDGNESVVHKGEEYNLSPSGSLVHPTVEVTPNVNLGYGVLIEKGVELFDGIEGRIDIGDRVRIKGTRIHAGVKIGDYSLVLADIIHSRSTLGEYVRIGEGVVIGSGVILEDAVKIDRDSQVGTGAIVGSASRIGYKARIGEGAEIAAGMVLGKFSGSGSRGINQDGIFVGPGKIVTRNT